MNPKSTLGAFALLAIVAGCGQSSPIIYSVSPTSGPATGSTTISISARNVRPGALVFVGGLCCNNIGVSPETGVLVAETPPGTLGTFEVAVRNKDATTGHFFGFTYVAGVSSVTITSVSPDQGATGTAVTIQGAGFQQNASVTFGSAPASSVSVQNPQTITCFAPNGSGIVAVTVTNTDGSSGTLSSAFTFAAGSAGGATITTFAGDGTAGFAGDGGDPTQAELDLPRGVALASNGTLYVSDTANNRIRQIVNGEITTFAGSGTQGFAGDNGPPLAAELDGPQGLALDSNDALYVADTGNSVIRVVSGTITTLAGIGTQTGNTGDGGAATSALLAQPEAVAVDSSGVVYIADTGNNRVRVVRSGTINPFAGDGTNGFSGDNGSAVNAELASPAGVVVEPNGTVWIADTGNGRVRRVLNGTILTEVGGGTGSSSGGQGLGGGSQGSSSSSTNSVGDGGAGTSAVLQSPSGLALDGNGNLLIADSVAERVRTVDLSSSSFTIETLAGDGTAGYTGDGGAATQATLDQPHAVASNGTTTFIADTQNSVIREVQ